MSFTETFFRQELRKKGIDVLNFASDGEIGESHENLNRYRDKNVEIKNLNLSFII